MPDTATLFALDPQTQQLTNLGETSQSVVGFTWRGDMSSAVYTALGSLCSTLYEHGTRDGPLALEVLIDGRRLPVGEDLRLTEDGCTRQSVAGHPSYGPDGETLAFVTAAVDGATGQARVGLQWSLFVNQPDGSQETVLEGLQDPQGVAWLTNEILIVAAKVRGLDGIWTVRRGGTNLARVATRALASISVAPDGHAVAGIGYETGQLESSLFIGNLASQP